MHPPAADSLELVEADLLQLVKPPCTRRSATVPKYPLSAGGGAGAAAGGAQPTLLETAMHAELNDSWRVHHSTAAEKAVKKNALEHILKAQVGCSALLGASASGFVQKLSQSAGQSNLILVHGACKPHLT